MTVAQVNQAIGCAGSSSANTQSFATYGWQAGTSLISVDFDPTGTTVTAVGGQFKTGINLVIANEPTAAACSQSNLTSKNYGAVVAGMTLAQVTQSIGCQSNVNAVTQSFVTFGWQSGSGLINVDFDPTGATVTAVGGQFKTGINLVFANGPTAAACTQSNLTTTNFNAIATGMTLAQVTQTIGCQSNSNAETQSFVSFGWQSGSSLINVDFDLTGATVTSVGGQFKTGIGLNNTTVPVAAVCSQSNLTVTNYNAVSLGMTVAQVNQVMGCAGASSANTQSFATYGWQSGASLVSVDFDPTGTTVTAIGGQFKIGINLVVANEPTAAACSQSNLTTANYNAIVVGMTLAQVTQTVGCQSNANSETQSFMTFGWQSGSSLISVDFDTTGTTVTSVGGQFKTGINLQ
jgi:hypothetical protein